MKNTEFRIGDHIAVYGNKGIVRDIEHLKEYELSYNGQKIGNGRAVMTDENAADTAARGYTVTPTGRTATYFTVTFENEPGLAGTHYDGGVYGCLDGFENYGTW